MDTLLSILKEFNPKNILEFGSGKSTGVMAMHHSVEDIQTYEHAPEYFARFNKAAFENVHIHLVEDSNEYASGFPKKAYDLVFMDGINRPDCMEKSSPFLAEEGIMLLHDADRQEYKEAISKFKYSVWTDEGNTVCLTNNVMVHHRLMSCLGRLKNVIGVKG